MNTVTTMLLSLILLIGALGANADSMPYTEGDVWQVSMIRTDANRTDDYLKQLKATFDTWMQAAKKQGLVEDYMILLGESANSSDFDLMIMVRQKNWAGRDRTKEWYDMGDKLFSEDEMLNSAKEYEKVREFLGSKWMRQIKLK
ncbi:hypothetical protein QP938_12155 [Porticoccaceae bacterium LTM1]|nr:hypothetical protein QP938_12155 [Porticoccaceae bacterium LTM1]